MPVTEKSVFLAAIGEGLTFIDRPSFFAIRLNRWFTQNQLFYKESAKTILWLAAPPDGGPTGGFFMDKKTIDW
jgi:hypothetical protein